MLISDPRQLDPEERKAALKELGIEDVFDDDAESHQEDDEGEEEEDA